MITIKGIILTTSMLKNIAFFCNSFIAVEPECINEIVQCVTDDIYDVEQCKTEFLTDKYGTFIELGE